MKDQIDYARRPDGMHCDLATETAVHRASFTLATAPLVKNANAVTDVIAAQLRAAQAAGDTPAYLNPEAEALGLLAMASGLGNGILSGHSSVEQAQTVIDYHLDRLFPRRRDS